MKTEVLEKPHASAPILGNKNKEKEEIFSKWWKLLKPEVLLHFATLKKSGWRPCLPLCQPAGLLARRQGHGQDLQGDCGRPPGTVSLMLRRHQHKTCVPCNILVPLCEKDPLLLNIHLGSQPWGSRTGNTQKSELETPRSQTPGLSPSHLCHWWEHSECRQAPHLTCLVWTALRTVTNEQGCGASSSALSSHFVPWVALDFPVNALTQDLYRLYGANQWHMPATAPETRLEGKALGQFFLLPTPFPKCYLYFK